MLDESEKRKLAQLRANVAIKETRVSGTEIERKNMCLEMLIGTVHEFEWNDDYSKLPKWGLCKKQKTSKVMTGERNTPILLKILTPIKSILCVTRDWEMVSEK